MAEDVVLEARNITKFFPPNIYANRGVCFTLRRGEIHVLLGENGAGKTTFVRMLFGELKPDEGEIYVKGEKVEFRSPRDAIARKIWMIHQHFRLVENLTVGENVALGLAGRLVFPEREVKPRLVELMERYGLEVDPDALIWQLSAGEKQRVEILKALYAGAEILILDEPTSILTPAERRRFFQILKELKRQGVSIIFITHKLDEALKGDRITVLRRGRVVATVEPSNISEEELVKMMVGEDVRRLELPLTRSKASRKEKPVLEVRNVWVMGDRGVYAVKGVSLEVYEGEIVGIAGVAGNGQKELAEAIAGLRRVERGEILIAGVNVSNKNARFVAELGTAFIPEDRIGTGIVPDLSVLDNFMLKLYYRREFTKRKLIIRYDLLMRELEKAVKRYCIKVPSPYYPVRTLSGGNIQKLIIARELAKKHRLIVALHPTYGLDVATTAAVRKILLEESVKGSAILLVSEDLEELLELSDRIAVMHEGKIVGVFGSEEASLEAIGRLMAGGKKEAVAEAPA